MAASDKEFEDIVKVSGHNFHARVVSKLRDDLDWTVVVSPYYSDNFTDKPRELDLIAEQAFKKPDLRTATDYYVVVRLFVECKFVNKPTVIWFDTKDQQKAIVLSSETNSSTITSRKSLLGSCSLRKGEARKPIHSEGRSTKTLML